MTHSCILGFLTNPSDIRIGIQTISIPIGWILTLTLDVSDTVYFVVDISQMSTTCVESQHLLLVPMLLIMFFGTLSETLRENSSLRSLLIIRLSVYLRFQFEFTSY